MSNYTLISTNSDNHGIFYKKAVNYQIFVEFGSKEFNASQLTHAEEKSSYWRSSATKPQIHVKFSHPVLITDYTLFKNEYNSCPKIFALYGKLNGRYRELDKREDTTSFNDKGQCTKEINVTYQTKKSFLTKNIILKQYKSTMNVDYLLLRAIELYGFVCKSCEMIHVTCSLKKNRLVFSIFIINLLK